MNEKILELFPEFKWYQGKLLQGDKWICNYFPVVTKQYRELETNDMLFELEVYIGENQAVRRVYSKEQISRINYFDDVSERCCENIEFGRKKVRDLMEYVIKTQISVMKEQVGYLSTLGWHRIGENVVYCAGNRIIGKKPEGLEVCPTLAQRYNIPLLDEPSRAMEACERFIENKNECAVAMTLVLVVSCLRSIFISKGVPVNFSVIIYGKTATYNTTLAKYFCRLYGTKQDMGQMMVELESTLPAIEDKMRYARDCCFLVDDLAPEERNKATKEKKETVGKLIRRFYSGQGFSKMNGKKEENRKMEAVLVFTAEELLQTQSAVNRTWIIDVNEFRVKKNLLEYMQEYENFSVDFTCHVIEWCALNYSRACKIIADASQKYRDERGKMSVYMRRLHEFGECFYIAWQILKEMDDSRLCRFDADVKKMITRILMDNQKKIVNMQFGKNAVDMGNIITEALENEELQIAQSKKDYDNGKNRFAGFCHKGNICLDRNAVYQYVRMENAQITVNQIGRALEDKGILKKDRSGASTKKVAGERYWIITDVRKDFSYLNEFEKMFGTEAVVWKL